MGANKQSYKISIKLKQAGCSKLRKPYLGLTNSKISAALGRILTIYKLMILSQNTCNKSRCWKG